MKLAIIFCLAIACASVAVALSSCGRAHANDMHIESLQAADGNWCYVVVQNGNAAGLSCK